MEKRKIEVLKRIDESKNHNTSEDYESLGKAGFDKGFLRAMISDGHIGWSGSSCFLTERGENVLRDYLIIESFPKRKMKTRVIFDTHVNVAIADGLLNIEQLKDSKEKFDFYITQIQVDEMNKCGDEEKRARIFLIKTNLAPIIIATESAVFDVSRFGHAKLGNGKVFEQLRQNNKKHTRDALIGETAIENNMILVTDDKTLRTRVNTKDGKAVSFDEFKTMLNENISK